MIILTIRMKRHMIRIQLGFRKTLESIHKICYIKSIKGEIAHKVVDLPSVLKAYLNRQVQGRLIYLRLLILSI